jgi:hypothetical protein
MMIAIKSIHQGIASFRQYLGPVRRAGQGVIITGTTPDREDLVIARAGFETYERHVVPAGQVARSADIVAWTFFRSGSRTAPVRRPAGCAVHR